MSTPPADGPGGGWRAPQEPAGWGPPPGAPAPGPAGAPPGPPAPGWGAAPAPAPGTAPGRPPQGWGQLAGPGAQPYGSVLTRRGIIALKPLGFGDFFDGAFRAIRHNPKVMIGLTALVLGVTNILVALPLTGLVASPAFTDPDAVPTDAELTGMLGSLAAFIPLSFVQSMAVIALTGVLILSVTQSVVDRRLTIGQVWSRARGRVWPLIGWSLLQSFLGGLLITVALAPGIALLVLEEYAGGIVALVLLVVGAIVLGAWLVVSLTFVPVLIVVERLGVVASVRRSFALIKGAFWKTLLILFLTGLLTGAVSQVLSFPFAILGSLGLLLVETEPVLGGIIYVGTTALGATVGIVIAVPFLAAVVALLYIDRRIRLEGLDVALGQALENAPEDRPA